MTHKIRSYSRKSEIVSPEKAAVRLDKKSIASDIDNLLKQNKKKLNYQNNLQKLIADRNLGNAAVYNKVHMDRKLFSKIISTKDYIPKKQTVILLGLALELPLSDFENYLATAGYAFSLDPWDQIVRYCVIKQIYNPVEIDMYLNDHGEKCFSIEE